MIINIVWYTKYMYVYNYKYLLKQYISALSLSYFWNFSTVAGHNFLAFIGI